MMSEVSVQQLVEAVVIAKALGSLAHISTMTACGFQLLPVVGCSYDFIRGNLQEAAISLVGDLSLFAGLSAAQKAHRCVYAGTDLYKFSCVMVRNAKADCNIADQWKHGFFTFGGGVNGDAWGYCGEAILRLLGIPSQATCWLRKFVQGNRESGE